MSSTPIDFAIRVSGRCRNQGNSLYLNDIRLADLIAENDVPFQTQATEFCVQGRNVVGLEIAGIAQPFDATDEQGRRLAAEVELHAERIDWASDRTTQLVALARSGNPGAYEGHLPASNVLEDEFEIPEPLPAWAWTTAPIIDVTEAVRTEVFAYIQELHAALARGDVAAFHREAEIRSAEMALAYPESNPEQGQRHVRTLVEAQHRIGQWALHPIELDRTLILPCAYGRMLQVVHEYPDWPFPMPPFRSDGELSSFGATTFAVRLARIDGSWKIVR